jgi:phage protein U
VQFLGAGDEKISLSGSVYAEITDGRVSLDQLREMADQGEALPLLDGSGLVFGSFVIEAIDERHAGLMADGRPLRIDFAIDLLRVDDPAGALPAQHGMTTLTNIPDWRVTLDGTDLTERMRPRLVSLPSRKSAATRPTSSTSCSTMPMACWRSRPRARACWSCWGGNRGATWPPASSTRAASRSTR